MLAPGDDDTVSLHCDEHAAEVERDEEVAHRGPITYLTGLSIDVYSHEATLATQAKRSRDTGRGRGRALSLLASAPQMSDLDQQSSVSPAKFGVRFALVGLVIASVVACAGYIAGRDYVDEADLPGEEVTLAAPSRAEPAAATAANDRPARLVPHVIASFPHDPDAFTQGLVWDRGRIFESTGLVGRSSVREVDLASGRVLRTEEVGAPRFAEGLALVGDELVQITWQDHVALVYGREDFAARRQYQYDTEGWGLCNDGSALVMSDGTSTLYFRDPSTFAVVRQVVVRREGIELDQLNELECVHGKVYANVWQTNMIVRIDPLTGRVEAVIDAGGLLTSDERRDADVLNGIAYIPERDHFLITGKLWPRMFEVTFEAAR